MKGIVYPSGNELVEFNKRYVEKISPGNINDINCFLSLIKFEGKELNFETLVTLSFDKLLKLKEKLLSFSAGYQYGADNEFNALFNYENRHQSIAKFFRSEKNLSFKTCFYCNIDYINSFVDLEDYKDGYDFINNADENELQYMEGLGSSAASKILEFRKFTGIIDPSNIEMIIANKELLTRILSLSLDNTHDHFTLDHFLPQSIYPFLSLCLYNLIPSCYSCNSKFKKANTLPLRAIKQ